MSTVKSTEETIYVHGNSSSAQMLWLYQALRLSLKRLYFSVSFAVFDDDPTVPTTTNLYIGCINPKVGTVILITDTWIIKVRWGTIKTSPCIICYHRNDKTALWNNVWY